MNTKLTIATISTVQALTVKGPILNDALPWDFGPFPDPDSIPEPHPSEVLFEELER